MASLSIINKPHTKRENCQTKRHTNSLTQKKRQITHLDVQSNALTQRTTHFGGKQFSIKFSAYLLHLFLVALVHHYFTLQLFIYPKTSLLNHILVVGGVFIWTRPTSKKLFIWLVWASSYFLSIFQIDPKLTSEACGYNIDNKERNLLFVTCLEEISKK